MLFITLANYQRLCGSIYIDRFYIFITIFPKSPAHDKFIFNELLDNDELSCVNIFVSVICSFPVCLNIYFHTLSELKFFMYLSIMLLNRTTFYLVSGLTIMSCVCFFWICKTCRYFLFSDTLSSEFSYAYSCLLEHCIYYTNDLL